MRLRAAGRSPAIDFATTTWSLRMRTATAPRRVTTFGVPILGEQRSRRSRIATSCSLAASASTGSCSDASSRPLPRASFVRMPVPARIAEACSTIPVQASATGRIHGRHHRTLAQRPPAIPARGRCSPGSTRRCAAAAARLPGSPATTLGATALVHEAYLKLCDANRLDLVDRHHFFACAARAMRRSRRPRTRAPERGAGIDLVSP